MSETKQVRFVRTTRNLGSASVDGHKLVLGGLAVDLTDEQIERLRQMPGCTFDIGGSDGLDGLKRGELDELARERGIDPAEHNNIPALIAAIRANDEQ